MVPLVLSIALLALTGAHLWLAFNLYRRLERWYREDASRLWKSRPWRWTLPVIGFGLLTMGAAFLGAVNRMIEPWAFVGSCMPVGLSFMLLGRPALSPTRHALDEVRRHPLDYPVPEVTQGQQGKVALITLAGVALFIGLLIAFAVWFSISLS